MPVSPSQIDGRVALAALLAEHRTLPPPAALSLIRRLAQQTAQLHAGGMLCGTIIPSLVRLDDDLGPHLASASPASLLALDGDWASLLPELTRLEPLPLPATLDAAQNWLQAGDVTLDPRQIDLCQLGALWCRLLTGEAPGAYLRSPRVKGLVPGELRPLLERSLGSSGSERFADVQEFVAELQAAAGQFAPPPTISDLDGASADANPVITSSPARTTSDTTPSFVSSGGEGTQPDTALGSGQPDAIRESDESLPFARLGHYDIVSRIGRGGMGDVYRGYERVIDRTVAIKVLPADLARQDDFVRRFKAEATAAARLIHPNVIQIYFIGEDSGNHFFAMRYVEGESLAGLLARKQKLNADQTLAIVEQALAGLAAAHNQGLIHRDIKPGNILLDSEHRRALLADFGLVKSLDASVSGKTATGVVMGTVDYISPEQGRGQTVDGRSDLYSMGVLLYQMLAGRLPFNADSPTALIFQHVYENPPPLVDVPSPLASIVNKLMMKRPADRYQTAEEVLGDLRAFRSGQPLPSGADRQRPSPPAGPTSVTTIIHAPQFEEFPDLPAVAPDQIAPHNLWDRVQDRAHSLFRRHAPEVLEKLQNTRQQFDGAVAEYSRRERKLADLVREAEFIQGDLLAQAAGQRSAARQAQERGKQAPDANIALAASSDELACVQAAEELERQAAEQDEQLGAMRVRLAQVRARAQELRNQRDILNARLKTAGAHKFIDGGVRTRSRLVQYRTIIAGSLAAIVIVAWFANQSRRDPAPAAPSPAAATNSGRNSVGASTEAPAAPKHRDVPAALLANPQQIFQESPVDVLDLAYSADGNRLWGVARPTRLLFLNLGSKGDVVLGQRGANTPLQTATFSPDRLLVAGGTSPGEGGEAVVEVWRVEGQKRWRSLPGKFSEVRSLSFGPDSTLLAAVCSSAGKPGTVHFWDLDSGTSVAGSDIPVADAQSVLFHPDGNRVAVVGADSSVTLWDRRAGQAILTLTGLHGRIGGLAFSPDGAALVSGDESGAVVMWDSVSGQRLGQYSSFENPITAVAFSPGGKLLATADSQEVTLWDARTGTLRKVLRQPNVTTLAFSVDGGRLATSNRSSPPQVWSSDVDTKPMYLNWDRTFVQDVPTASTRIIPLAGRSLLFGAGRQIVRFNSDLNVVAGRLEGHTSRVRALVLARQAGVAFSGSEDGTVRVWNPQSGDLLEKVEFQRTTDGAGGLEPIWSLAVTPDASRLLIGTERSAFLWDRGAGMQPERLDLPAGSTLATDISEDGHRGLAAGFGRNAGRGHVQIIDLDLRRELHLVEGDQTSVTEAMFVNSGSEFIYVAGSRIYWHRLADFKEIRTLKSAEAAGPPTIGRSPDGACLAIADGLEISLRDARNGDEMFRLSGIIKDPVLQAMFTPDGRYVIALQKGNAVSYGDVFPTKALTRQIGHSFLTANSGEWFMAGDEHSEIAWRRLGLDRPVDIQFDGPANAPQLRNFRPDGAWNILDGHLVRQPGSTRAAIDLGSVGDADFHFTGDFEKTNTLFVMVGWNGHDGHLLYKQPHDAGGEWWLCSSRQGSFQTSTPVRLASPIAAAGSSTKVNVLLKSGSLELRINDQPAASRVPLPAYANGHVVLGIVDGRRGDASLRLNTFGVNLN